MDLRSSLAVLKRRALTIAIVTLMALTVVIVASLVIPPVYQAHTVVRVLVDVGVSDFIMREDYVNRLLNTYAELLKGDAFFQKAIERIPQLASWDPQKNPVSVAIVPNTELLDIAVEHDNPAVARDLANTMSALLSEYAQGIYVGSSKSTAEILQEQLAGLSSTLAQNRQALAELTASGGAEVEIQRLNSEIQFSEDAYDRLLDRYELARLNENLRANGISVVAPATLPETPVNGLDLRRVALALVIGLLGGIGLALVLENLDMSIHSSEQLEQLSGLPVLARMPRGSISATDLDGGNPPQTNEQLIEIYRQLCIRILGMRKRGEDRDHGAVQTILVTSAVAKEGKSMVAANLARVFADQGQSAYLVEANLRDPVVSKRIGVALDNWSLDSGPLHDSALAKLIRPTPQPHLFVIGDGQKVPNPTAVLASPSMINLLNALKTHGQVTVLDGPPVLGVADASVLAPQVDGVIFVVRQSFSNREPVTMALRQLQAMEAHVLGLVFVQDRCNKWGC